LTNTIKPPKTLLFYFMYESKLHGTELHLMSSKLRKVSIRILSANEWRKLMFTSIFTSYTFRKIVSFYTRSLAKWSYVMKQHLLLLFSYFVNNEQVIVLSIVNLPLLHSIDVNFVISNHNEIVDISFLLFHE